MPDEELQHEHRHREREAHRHAGRDLVADVAAAVAGAEVQREQPQRAVVEDRLRVTLSMPSAFGVEPQRLVVAALDLPLLDRSCVTRLPPMFRRAMSSGVLTVKNSMKVSRLTPIRISTRVADAADDVVQHVRGPDGWGHDAVPWRQRARRRLALAPPPAAERRHHRRHQRSSDDQDDRPPDRPVPFGDLRSAQLAGRP